MSIKILLVGNDPVAMVADGQLLRDRGFMVYTAFNLDNIGELITEIKPDLIFFNPHKQHDQVTDVYNNIVNSIYFTNIPVIFTLSEDDVYLITRKRTESKEKRTIISDNIIDAIKMALRSNKAAHKKSNRIHIATIAVPNYTARA
jgi:response regulator RpfG family c-di-GMP phosphodiesterase